MEKKVKLQFNCDIEDVTRLSSFTLEECLENITLLQSIVNEIKKNLWSIDISQQEQRQILKNLLLNADNARILLSKIDVRLGDVSSVVSGLNSIFEPSQESKKGEKDDSISSG